MIKRYESKVVADIWSEEQKLEYWKLVEISYAERSKEISDEELDAIYAAETPTVEEVQELEKETNHDLSSFVRLLGNNSGIGGKYIHRGLTSSDIVDTAQSLAIQQSLEFLLSHLSRLSKTLLKLSMRHKYTFCIARTHGIHAEVSTFGLRILNWYSELKRNVKRILTAKENLRFGKLSGAIGTYRFIDPEIEKETLNSLGLKVEPISTQVIPRDRYAEMFLSFSLLASNLERIATELRTLQRTEIGETCEGFSKHQIGSSAMPHKKNPVSFEKVCGLARVIRSYGNVALENINLWGERDISHSSTERMILPDSFHLMVHMVSTINHALENLKVDSERMLKNIKGSTPAIFSEDILDHLLSQKNIQRQEAYSLARELSKQKRINLRKYSGLSMNELLLKSLENVDEVFRRVLND